MNDNELEPFQAEFFYKFLKHAKKKNIELFASLCEIYPPKLKFDIYEAISLEAKLLNGLTKAKKSEKIIGFINALYYCYHAFEPYSDRTVPNHDEFGNPHHSEKPIFFDDYGSLNNNEYREFINFLIRSIKKNKFYYRRNEAESTLTVVYLNRKFNKTKIREFKIKSKWSKNYKSMYLERQKIELRNKKFFDNTLNIGLNRLLAIHKQVFTIIKSTEEKACCYCNRTIITKKKCNNCKILYKRYRELCQIMPELPKNLAQIIKRINIEDCITEIEKNEKIKTQLWNRVQKERKALENQGITVDFNKNNSNVLALFRSALNRSFPVK